MRCWGKGGAGNIGNGSFADRPSPTLVSGLTHIKQVSSGYDHVCAVFTFNGVVCWGQNSQGQLGTGAVDSNPRTSPSTSRTCRPRARSPEARGSRARSPAGRSTAGARTTSARRAATPRARS
ncbi:MAG: hypothetical protein U0838_17685 [Chloroflexota bacterium]